MGRVGRNLWPACLSMLALGACKPSALVDDFLNPEGIGKFGQIGDSAFRFTPTAHDFGILRANNESAEQTITIANRADSTVYLNSIGGESAHFSVVSHGCPMSPEPFESGAECSALVRFQPLAAGELSYALVAKYSSKVTGGVVYSSVAALQGKAASPLVFAGLQSIDTVTHKAATLRWNAVAEASSFFVFRIESGSMIYVDTIVNSGGAVSFAHVSGLTPGTAYQFRVRAADVFGGLDANTADVSATTLPNTLPDLASIAAQTAYQGSAWSVNASNQSPAGDTDGDGDALTYTCHFDTNVDGSVAATNPCASLVNQGGSAAGFDAATGVLAWTPPFSVAAGTDYEFKITATDPYSGSDTVVFAVEVQSGTPVIVHSVTAGAPCATTTGDCVYPSGAISPGVALGVDFANSNTGSDAGVASYTCYFDQSADATVASATACSSLPGTATFSASTGVLSWTSSAATLGPFEIKVTGTNAGGSGSQIFVVDVQPSIATSGLLGFWDAQFGNGRGHGRNAPTFDADLKNLASSGAANDGDLTNFAETSASGWAGNGSTTATSADHGPYRLGFDGVNDVVKFGTGMNGQASVFFDTWIRPGSFATAGSTIVANADTGGKGFRLRQSSTVPGILDFGIGTNSAYEEVALALSPRLYFSFADKFGTTAVDRSGNATHATINGAMTLNASGIPGNSDSAFTFNGTNAEVSLPHGTITNITGDEMTIAAWINPSSFPGSFAVLVHKEMQYTFALYGNALTFAHSGNWSYANTGQHGTLNAGEWQHVALVKSTAGYAFYLNGSPVGTYTAATAQTQISTSTATFHIGAYNGNQMYFHGSMQHVGVYSTALSPANIAALYAAGTSAHCRSRVALADDLWSHVAGYFDNTLDVMKLYVNGVEQCAVTNATQTFASSGVELTAGAVGAGSSAWTGQVGDLRVYSGGTAATATTNFAATRSRFDEYVPTADLKGWWRADVLNQAHNTAVSYWPDFGSRGNHALQTNAGKQPLYAANAINGKPALKFDGSSSCIQTLTGDALGDYSVFVVYQALGAGGSYDRILDKDYANGFWLGRNNTAANDWGGGVMETSHPYGIFHTFSDASANVMTSIRSGTTHLLYRNGTLGTSNTVASTVTSATKYGFGCYHDDSANQRYNGYIAEILVYSSALSSADRLRVERYLGAKYGVTVP